MNDPLQPYYKTIGDMKAKGLYTPVRVLESPQGPWFTIDGKKLLNFCSNNYLGFAQDKRLVAAVIKAVKKYGVGAGAVGPAAGFGRVTACVMRMANPKLIAHSRATPMMKAIFLLARICMMDKNRKLFSTSAC